jgi:large subunit ribosomal protein L10
MNKADKSQIIDDIAGLLASSKNFYLADTSELPSDKTQALRKACFEKQIKLIVVKNTLLRKALERTNDSDWSPMYVALKGSTSIMLSETSAGPAKLIKEFRIKNKKPVLKAAWVEQSVYVGDDQLDSLAAIKSKNEMIGDIIAALQAPARNVISGLVTHAEKKGEGAEASSETPA